MILTEFGIMPSIDRNKEYNDYEPEQYNCISIDDDLYIDAWWEELEKIDTYFHGINNPSKALNRHGITLIPPESLTKFEDIVINDKRLSSDPSLIKLLELIRTAKKEEKFMIHFGI